MSVKCGIVGLPNVGKSTLFNALTKAEIAAENFPFCTIEPNSGVVPVPDERLDNLSAIVVPQKVIPTMMEFTDIAGLVAGASKGEGLGNQFLANIRECDAIAHVVRCFEDENVTHVSDKIDPTADIETIDTELALADLETVDKTINRVSRVANSGDKDAQRQFLLLEKVKAHLDQAKAVRTLELGEEEELNKKRKILINYEKIILVINESKEIIEKEQGLEDLTNRIFKILDKIQSVASNNLVEALDIIKRASTEIEEFKIIINKENLEINQDSENLETIEDRLHELRTQARKHNCNVDQLLEIKESLILKLNRIDNNKSFINNLKDKYQDIIIKYKLVCDLLSKSRLKSAIILSKEINNELPYLKLENANFEILVEKLDNDEFTVKGMDKITFLATTNSGMGMLPINKIASGGELSRFLLAIKVVIETGIQNRTIIFDEIDSGIGGAVANAVGIRLAKLGTAYQTIIVTHSPQVTSKGHHHYLIEKNIINNITYSKVTELYRKDRVEEIARMLSGDTVTIEAREAASKLLNDNAI